VQRKRSLLTQLGRHGQFNFASHQRCALPKADPSRRNIAEDRNGRFDQTREV
jgi:hypothetical protein